jgi:uncharacterized protein YjiS (DUF1127 family)
MRIIDYRDACNNLGAVLDQVLEDADVTIKSGPRCSRRGRDVARFLQRFTCWILRRMRRISQSRLSKHALAFPNHAS